MATFFIFVNVLFESLQWLIIARVILSWIPMDPYHPVIRFIYDMTEPILAPIRKIIPTGNMPIDFSPILAIFLVQLVHSVVIQLLRGVLLGS